MSTAAPMVMFSARSYDRESFETAPRDHRVAVEVQYVDARLTVDTAPLAAGATAVCAFVTDDLGAPVLELLAAGGTTIVALRSAGFNHVDLGAAARLGLTVVRVPAYSPHAVAEHTLALILALNRHIPRAYNRVRDGNFALDGLVGSDLAGKTATVVGTGRIGALVARMLWHLRCRVLAVDPCPDAGLVDLGIEYVDLAAGLAQADLISLNCPLTAETTHLIDAESIATLRPGVMVVNTGRGALIDASAAIAGLTSHRIGSLALDVYEEEDALFFEDRSDQLLDDDVFARLLTFPNVIITAHQAFLTHDALAAIAETTLRNVRDVVSGRPCDNTIR